MAASALRKAAEQAAAGAQTPAEHFADVVDGLVRIIPGGGVMNAAVKTVTTIAENEEIAACARDVAGDLGRQFILNVVAKVAREHGGELVLDAVDVATKPLLGAATFSLTHHGSHWA